MDAATVIMTSEADVLAAQLGTVIGLAWLIRHWGNAVRCCIAIATHCAMRGLLRIVALRVAHSRQLNMPSCTRCNGGNGMEGKGREGKGMA
jgi:hypothetical protein